MGVGGGCAGGSGLLEPEFARLVVDRARFAARGWGAVGHGGCGLRVGLGCVRARVGGEGRVGGLGSFLACDEDGVYQVVQGHGEGMVGGVLGM